MTPSEAAAVIIEPVQEKHCAELARLERDFLNSKRMCCCLPLGVFTSEDQFRNAYRKRPEMMKAMAVALLDEQVVGFIQLRLHDMPCELHKVEKDEVYVYMITVDPDVRGLGVGSKLLDWSEDIARQRSCNRMSLHVLGGNKAIGLYERKGYVAKPESIFQLPFTFLFVSLLLGLRTSPRVILYRIGTMAEVFSW